MVLHVRSTAQTSCLPFNSLLEMPQRVPDARGVRHAGFAGMSAGRDKGGGMIALAEGRLLQPRRERFLCRASFRRMCCSGMYIFQPDPVLYIRQLADRCPSLGLWISSPEWFSQVMDQRYQMAQTFDAAKYSRKGRWAGYGVAVDEPPEQPFDEPMLACEAASEEGGCGYPHRKCRQRCTLLYSAMPRITFEVESWRREPFTPKMKLWTCCDLCEHAWRREMDCRRCHETWYADDCERCGASRDSASDVERQMRMIREEFCSRAPCHLNLYNTLYVIATYRGITHVVDGVNKKYLGTVVPLLLDLSALTFEEEAELMWYLMFYAIWEAAPFGYVLNNYVYVPRKYVELLEKAGYKIDVVKARRCDWIEDDEDRPCQLVVEEDRDGYHYKRYGGCGCDMTIVPKKPASPPPAPRGCFRCIR